MHLKIKIGAPLSGDNLIFFSIKMKENECIIWPSNSILRLYPKGARVIVCGINYFQVMKSCSSPGHLNLVGLLGVAQIDPSPPKKGTNKTMYSEAKEIVQWVKWGTVLTSHGVNSISITSRYMVLWTPLVWSLSKTWAPLGEVYTPTPHSKH